MIVRLHRLISHGQLAVWNGGVVLERLNAKADLVESIDRRQISVRATGARAKELVTIVAEKFNELHSGFGDRLKVEIKIPCNCSVCKTNNTPHFYDLNDLENRLTKGKNTIECRESFEDVNVQNLLNGVFTRTDQTTFQLLQSGLTREALKLLMPNDEAALLLNQLDKAEKEFDFGRVNPDEFTKEKNRITVAAMKLAGKES